MLSRKTIVFLALLLALLLAGQWFGERHLADADGADPAGATLVPPAPSRATAFSLRAGPLSVSLSRPGSRWMLDPPAAGRADSRRVDLALDTVLRARVRDRITERQRKGRRLELSDYGLSPSRARVAVSGAGWSAAVEFGDHTPGGDGVFALAEGSSDVLVVDRAVLDLLPQSLDDLRDRTLFSGSVPAPEALEIRRPGAPAVRLARSADGVWSLEAPYRSALSAPAVSALLETLRNASVTRFVWTPGSPGTSSEALIAHGLSPDEAVLALSVWRAGEASPDDFAFGQPDPADASRVFAATLADGAVCTVDRAVLDALRMPLDVLRDRRPFPYAPEELLSVSFQSGDGAFALERPDAASPWSLSRPSAQPADQEAVERFLERILDLRDESAEPLSPADSAEPLDAVRLELLPVPPAPPLHAWLSRRAAAGDGGVPEEAVVAVPERGVRHVLPSGALPHGALAAPFFASLRDPAVLALPPGALSSLTRRTPDGEEQTVRLGGEGAWFSAKPPAVADRAAAEALSGLLTNLVSSGAATLFTPDSAAYGLLPPRLEIVASTTLTNRPVVILQLGSALPDGSAYLRVRGEDPVFTLPPDVASVLSAPLLQTR